MKRYTLIIDFKKYDGRTISNFKRFDTNNLKAAKDFIYTLHTNTNEKTGYYVCRIFDFKQMKYVYQDLKED